MSLKQYPVRPGSVYFSLSKKYCSVYDLRCPDAFRGIIRNL